jgi:hypothetical protein
MQRIAHVRTVFVYLVQAGKETDIPNLDHVWYVGGFFPNLTGMFKDMFVDDDENFDIIFIAAENLLKEHCKFQEETGIGCMPPYANYTSHDVMVEQDDLHWEPDDWVFLLTQQPGNVWVIKGGSYHPWIPD